VRGVVWDGKRLAVTDELELGPPGPAEVQLALAASGLCHTELSILDGHSPCELPAVLGHEAAGVVAELGPGVSGWQRGDAVAVSNLTPCGRCRACGDERFTDCAEAFGGSARPFRLRGTAVSRYANCSSFAARINVRADQLIATRGIPPEHAALIGCAVTTGYGAVRNAAHVREGESIAVFGIGGIGVNALQTARLLGAAPVIAVDVAPAREAIARRFGATDFVCVRRDAGAREIARALRALVPAGVDAAIECSGALAAVDAAIASLGVGGRASLVGIPPHGARASFDVSHLMWGRSVIGSLNGAMHPQRDLAEIVDHVLAGRLELAAQVSRTWPLAEVEAAVAALRAGEVVRAVLLHEG
jgi:S-(hydroxymethyl)glutathione dehydrogenase/alcohol dehydrogenase